MSEKEDGHDERLRELRERLYSRSKPPAERERRELPDQVHQVENAWKLDTLETYAPPTIPSFPSEMPLSMKKPKRAYRTKLIVGGLLFFFIALLLSGSFLLFGKNEISGKNISIEVSGPSVAGGGEELPLQVTIANKNAVTLESATLIIEYPYGTQSADEPGKELTRDRKPLAPLKPGEMVNIPINARVFGEENEEKNILISLEYRVQGSNGTFVKPIDSPYRFKISSSPVVLFVEKIDKSASGQDIQFNITVTSNSQSEISQLLLKAEYPQGFDFIEAKPSAASGRDTWSITNLKPGGKQTVSIKGALVGKQDEAKIFTFSVGIPNERDKWSLASVLSVQKEEIKIEQPFLDVGVEINGSGDADVAVPFSSTAQVSITFKNTLSSTLYDGTITVDLSGNGLNESEVSPNGGFYDSSANTIVWNAASTDSLKSMQPGGVSTVSFNLRPTTAVGRTPQVTFKVSAEGNRVSEGNVSERLTGTASRTIKVESVASLSSRALYSTGAFTNTGPVPPRAEQVTTYTMRLAVKNGTNAVADGMVTTRIPQYVTWLDLSSDKKAFSYNPQSREISWKVGDLAAGGGDEAEFQVSFKPSLTQVGQEPTLLEGQAFKAVDRFTGTTIRSEAPALTTKLTNDPQYSSTPGQVVGAGE